MFYVSFHGREFACLFSDALIEKIFETSTESILHKFRKEIVQVRGGETLSDSSLKCRGKKPGPTAAGFKADWFESAGWEFKE